YRDYKSATSDGWQLMEAILKRLVAAAAPTPVLILPLPHYYFYHDGLKPIYQPLFEGLNAPRRGVHVMDVTRPLARLPWDDKKRIAFKYDSHYTPFGHQQVARVLTEFIQSRSLLRQHSNGSSASARAPVTVGTNGAPGNGHDLNKGADAGRLGPAIA